MSETPGKSYGQIVKSSALIGGSTAFGLACGILRAKAMALILGTSGVGLLGMFSNIADLTRSIAGLGINSSGVRQIAESVSSGDTHRVACTVITLRRVALYSGALGALLLLLFSKQVAWISFDNYKYTGAVALLAVAAFLGDISAAQAALVQGMRRIGDLARMNILGAVYGTVFGIGIIYFWKENGVVPSLICVAAMSIVTSWWYARKIKIESVKISWRQIIAEASPLVKFGVVFMASGIGVLGSLYFARMIVIRALGESAAGCYQAAWALGGMYIGFILQAMGADFYPRLTAVAGKNEECNQLVNEQAEVGLLMAGPGIMATLTFAPLIITLFYTSEFAPAAEILRWLCLGMLMRAIAWPMGFIVLAKGAKGFFFWNEVCMHSGYVGLVWLGVHFFGLPGAGMAFLGLNAANCIAAYIIAHRLSGFRWSPASRRLGLTFAPLVGIVFAIGYFPANPIAIVTGFVVTVGTGIYSLKTLCRLVPHEHLPRVAQKVIRLLRLVPSNSN